MRARSKRRTPRRIGRRGAVLTEAVIVLVFFVIVFGCGSFVHRLYASKLRTAREARERVWARSMGACAEGGGIGGAGVGSSLLPETERLFGSAAGMDLLESPVVSARQESVARVTAGANLGLAPADVRSGALVTCNERVLDTDPNAAAEIAWRGLTGW